MKFRIIQLVALLILLSGCSQNRIPDWLSGEWTFDVEATTENIKASLSKESVDITDGLLAAMIPALKDMEMTISQESLITLFNGKKKLSEIEIYQVESNSITLKLNDGDLREFNKSENGFWTLSDDGNLKMFFKRKDSQPGE